MLRCGKSYRDIVIVHNALLQKELTTYKCIFNIFRITDTGERKLLRQIMSEHVTSYHIVLTIWYIITKYHASVYHRLQCQMGINDKHFFPHCAYDAEWVVFLIMDKIISI